MSMLVSNAQVLEVFEVHETKLKVSRKKISLLLRPENAVFTIAVSFFLGLPLWFNFFTFMDKDFY